MGVARATGRCPLGSWESLGACGCLRDCLGTGDCLGTAWGHPGTRGSPPGDTGAPPGTQGAPPGHGGRPPGHGGHSQNTAGMGKSKMGGLNGGHRMKSILLYIILLEAKSCVCTPGYPWGGWDKVGSPRGCPGDTPGVVSLPWGFTGIRDTVTNKKVPYEILLFSYF